MNHVDNASGDNATGDDAFTPSNADTENLRYKFILIDLFDSFIVVTHYYL